VDFKRQVDFICDKKAVAAVEEYKSKVDIANGLTRTSGLHAARSLGFREGITEGSQEARVHPLVIFFSLLAAVGLGYGMGTFL
jgi:hypothetical protein